VPFVRTIRPPKTAIIMKIGSNQNFFRTLKNVKNSIRKDFTVCSKLIAEAVWRWPRWVPKDPIGFGVRIYF
jgi:hypothetical protein